MWLMRHRPQAAHDAADAQRVGDGLAQPVFLRHFEVRDRGGLVATNLECDDDEIGALQRLSLIGVGFDLRRNPQRLRQLAGDDLALLEALRVDVHQRNRRVRQRRALQGVADDVLHEHRGARADEGDLGLSGHARMPLLGRMPTYAAIWKAARTSRSV
jgi:hypothetical protein